MHMLSSQNLSEFLACPQLIRFEYADGLDGFEPTLLVKGRTVFLKYIVLGARMQLAFTKCGQRLLYALKIFDDGDEGGILWSVAEREEELSGIRGMIEGAPLMTFLFNELAINVAWNDLPTSGKLDDLEGWIDNSTLGPVDHSAMKTSVDPKLDRLHHLSSSDDEWIVLEVGGAGDWNPIRSHFVTASASSSLIDLWDDDEGNQQEQLGVWLTDNLQPKGAYHSPQIPKGKGTRELIDVLLSHEFGSILIESKTLAILAREKLPKRAKLKRDISAHVDKAFKQLRGAIRMLRSDVTVTCTDGAELNVEREKPPHAIVLIPDFTLVEDRSAYDLRFMQEFMRATGSFAHILDISELLRVVQAAEMITSKGTETTLMMAFDFYLVERFKKAMDADTLCVEVLFRYAEEGLPNG